ncbi:MAG: heparinase, partial [Paramuribaculum sp.]|nr:heparinase [Paramuribaculum sp.]
FLSWGDIDTSVPGKVNISVQGHKAQLNYDPTQFEATVADQPLPDTRLSNVWGPKISRISLTARKTAPKGTYKYSVKVL